MTVIATVLGGTSLAVMASDDSFTPGKVDTGPDRGARGASGPKVRALSSRFPLALGTAGVSGTGAVSIPAVVERCLRWCDALEPDAWTVRAVAEHVAGELWTTFAAQLRALAAAPWAQQITATLPPGVRNGRTIINGHVTGIPSAGPVETWAFVVTPAGVEDMELKIQGVRNSWRVLTSPGAHAAEAAVRGIMGQDCPRSLDRLRTLAGQIVQAQIDAGGGLAGLSVSGPVHFLGLRRGDSPLYPPRRPVVTFGEIRMVEGTSPDA